MLHHTYESPRNTSYIVYDAKLFMKGGGGGRLETLKKNILTDRILQWQIKQKSLQIWYVNQNKPTLQVLFYKIFH